jgi:biopolymer transport protein ExbB/TolQ
MKEDSGLIILYVLALVGIVYLLTSAWQVAVVLFITLLVTLLLKLRTDKIAIKEVEKREKLINTVSEKLEKFSDKFIAFSDEFKKNVAGLENKLDKKFMGEQKVREIEMDKMYRELAKKILEIENKTDKLRRNLGAGLGAMEDRMKEKSLEGKLSKIFSA